MSKLVCRRHKTYCALHYYNFATKQQTQEVKESGSPRSTDGALSFEYSLTLTLTLSSRPTIGKSVGSLLMTASS